jgi:hypothetical protein
MMSLDARAAARAIVPRLRVLVGALPEFVQVGGVLLVLSPVRSLVTPGRRTAVGLDDVVEDRQDAAGDVGGGSPQRELLMREAAAGGELLPLAHAWCRNASSKISFVPRAPAFCEFVWMTT